LFSLVLVLNISPSFGAEITSDPYVKDVTSNTISLNLDDGTEGSDTNSKLISTEGVTKENVATSAGDFDSNSADVSITPVASNYSPNYLKFVVFAVIVKNNGPNTAENVVVNSWLNHTYYKYISDDGNGSYNRLNGIWSVGTMENGTKTTLHLVAQIIKPSTTIYNSFSYKSGSTFDPNKSNNYAVINLTVPPASDVSVSQTASKYNPQYLYHTIITIVVKNIGPNSASNVTVNCKLDTNVLKYLSDDVKGSYNPNTGIWTIGTLKSGSQVVIHINTKVLVFNKVIRNLVDYQSDTYDMSRGNNRSAIVLSIPQLTIKSLSSSLAIGTSSNYDKAVNIFNWVRDYIEYSFYYGTKYGASGTINSLEGNCVDMSHLIVALAKTSGLPVRYKHGTCFFYESQHWYGHVWTNIYVNGPDGLKWYAADASNNNNDFGVIRNWNTTNFELHGIYSTLPF